MNGKILQQNRPDDDVGDTREICRQFTLEVSRTTGSEVHVCIATRVNDTFAASCKCNSCDNTFLRQMIPTLGTSVSIVAAPDPYWRQQVVFWIYCICQVVFSFATLLISFNFRNSQLYLKSSWDSECN